MSPRSASSGWREPLANGGFHGALDSVEGAVWRIERNELVRPGKSSERRVVVDFVVKYVRPDKVDDCYLPELNAGRAHWNWMRPYPDETELDERVSVVGASSYRRR